MPKKEEDKNKRKTLVLWTGFIVFIVALVILCLAKLTVPVESPLPPRYWISPTGPPLPPCYWMPHLLLLL